MNLAAQQRNVVTLVQSRNVDASDRAPESSAYVVLIHRLRKEKDSACFETLSVFSVLACTSGEDLMLVMNLRMSCGSLKPTILILLLDAAESAMASCADCHVYDKLLPHGRKSFCGLRSSTEEPLQHSAWLPVMGGTCGLT